jgi:tight adherence protein C
MDFTVLGSLIAFIVVLLGLVIAAVGLKFFDTSETQRRIKTFVLEKPDALQPYSLDELQNRDFTESLFQRTVISWLNTVTSFLGRYTPQQTIQETHRRLIIAGNPFNLRAPQYYGFRVLTFIIGIPLSIMVYQVNPVPLFLLMALLLLVIVLIAPGAWLSATMRQRQDMIRQGLPDALDMLSVCVAAGLSFDQALLRVGQTFKTPIGMEFSRVVSEIEIGVSRKQALRNLQARVDVSELSSFVAIILQSEALGMSIANVLHSQAEQMRIFRQYRAKEIAQKLPAKMMVPLALFIFPALWAVILGPTLPQLLKILATP